MRLLVGNVRWRVIEWLESFAPLDGEAIVDRLGLLAARRMP